MSRSHLSTPKPSPTLAIVALAVVHRLHPEWVAVSLTDVAVQQELSPQRLSRLCSRAITLFESVISRLTQRGRPKKADHQIDAELAQTRALLDVATSALQTPPLRGNQIRALLVGAWLRMQEHGQPPVTCRKFCDTLGISERVFRRWRNEDNPVSSDETKPAEPQTVPKRPKPRQARRGRFNFDVTLPDTQIAADTTELMVFGTKLKLIACQDVGGRDNDLLAGVLVDTRESSAHVEQVLSEALAGLEGAQVITDQGTPYIAETVRNYLESILVDHAPQREGDPLGKATIERAFGIVKSIAAPLFELTNRLAQNFPALAEPNLSKAFAKLVLIFLLRAYQAGARAAHRADEQRGSVDAETLARLAAENRDKARAELRSTRMVLEHVYQIFNIPIPKQKFVRQFGTRPLAVLKAAAKDFARQAHRDDIRDRTAYFGRLVHNHLEIFNKQQAKTHEQRQRDQQHAADQQYVEQRQRIWDQEPEKWLMHALKTIAAFWLPDTGVLVGGGAGPGRAWLRCALARLIERDGVQIALDVAHGTAHLFARAAASDLGNRGVQAVLKILNAELTQLHHRQDPSQESPERFAAALLVPDRTRR